ncbi:GreA/GreB family elongation factor [Methanolobus vulcani]|uniref:Tetratricopeptide repeat-containing protein n=1 Tax=Methanolobus vulcani TaxID=38026 RepID=A0A7Z8P282_9EURY|nr:GreA/GreB family elongation factor [Methanolobus vulcani]TQD27911.1 hypothetical protein FKV42_02290 [Methanolobus vulcani]
MADNDEFNVSTDNEDRAQFVTTALSSVPFVGGLISASANYVIKKRQDKRLSEALNKFITNNIEKKVEDSDSKYLSLHNDYLSLQDDFRSFEDNFDELKAGIKSIESQNFESEYQYLLESLRENVKENNPTEALKRLGNLKSKIWDKSPSNIRYALLSIEASANLKLNRYQDAGKLLIEAFQYSSIEKAMVNAAYGYFLLNDYLNSKKLVEEVLENNPTNARAFSILIQMFTTEEELDAIPDYLKETQDVAYAIGNFFLKINKFEEAIKWLEIAIVNEKETIIEMRPLLASILLDMILSDSEKIQEFQLNEKDKNTLKKVIDLITTSWNSISDPNLQKIHVDWIVNRCIAKHLLGNQDGFKDDINDAFKFDPSDSRIIYFKALMVLEHNEIEKAISLLKDIDFDKTIPEVPLLYFDLLRKQGKFADAITEINDFLEQNEDFQKIDFLYRILIYTYLDSDVESENCVEKAIDLADSRVKADPTNIENIIDLSQCLAKSGQIDSSKSHLINAKNIISDFTPTIHLMELADVFFRLNLFDDASEIYQKFVDSTQVTDLTHKLVESYYRCGDIGKALEISKSLREEFGIIDHITNIEIAIYHDIDDLSEAKKVLTEYISKYPDDMDMKLNLAYLNLRCNNLGDVENFLNTSFDIKSLSIENGIRLALLFNERGYFKEAIDILYEIRRYNFENENVHVAYIKLILFNEKEERENWLSPEKVDANTVVILEEDAGKQVTYILDDRSDVDFQKGEIGLESPLAKLIFGKTKGDKITHKTSLSQEILEVKDIKSKYIHAFQESLDKFNYLFPDTQALTKISFPKIEEEGIPQDFLKTITDVVVLRTENNSKAIELYLDKKLPIGTLATIIGQTIFDVWFEFTKNEDLGIYCSIGNSQEINEALNNLENSSKIVVDPLSLITVFTLNIGDLIVDSFGKLGIAQSTIDLLHETLIEQKKIYSRVHGFLVNDDKNLIFKETDSKDVEEKINVYEQMLNWIPKICEIIPCKEALSLKKDKKKEYDDLLGRAFVDTILIATENENILCTEDKVLRSIAKQEFNVDGIWTQPLLLHFLNNDIIDRNQYNELTIKLVNLHYYHTTINSEVLVEAARKTNWKIEDSLKNFLNILRGKNCDEDSALAVSTHFLSAIWNEKIPREDLYVLTLNLLSVIVQERFAPFIIDKIKNRVNINIHLFSSEDREEILELISLWEAIYYKSIL